ncbi:hypothetical protein [Rhizobium leguminosarum]|uniref:hypothetical protein n=1 Tax=Rhizobium leguminosarum TaxID=384 RepID=UPI002E0DE931|nr:hypothetical protein U8Q02_37535 [Rhizobium leguminosarum]
MSMFVKKHVKRLFKEAGYDLVKIDGDRGGIVQGDGLDLTVAPDVEALAFDFSEEPSLRRRIVEDSQVSRRLELELYGGSASANLEGIYVDADFLAFVKEKASETYYRAQREVNAIFAAEDAPDREWDDVRQAYVGVADEFAAQTSDGGRLFIRVNRVADQSFDAYESGDDAADIADATDIVEGRSSHGTVEIEIYEIAPDYVDEDKVQFDLPFSTDAYDPRMFRSDEANRIISAVGLVWPRSETEAYTLDLAGELADDEDEPAAARALKVRAGELGLAWQRPESDIHTSDPAPLGR